VKIAAETGAAALTQTEEGLQGCEPSLQERRQVAGLAWAGRRHPETWIDVTDLTLEQRREHYRQLRRAK
jgi:hypothetical protein